VSVTRRVAFSRAVVIATERPGGGRMRASLTTAGRLGHRTIGRAITRLAVVDVLHRRDVGGGERRDRPELRDRRLRFA
jgi:hypothetical protein